MVIPAAGLAWTSRGLQVGVTIPRTHGLLVTAKSDHSFDVSIISPPAMKISQAYFDKLKLDVATRNSVHAKLNEAQAKLRLALEEFKGKKVQLASGALTKRCAAVADQALRDCGLFFDEKSRSYNESFRFYFLANSYWLNLEIDRCYQFEGRTSYVKGYIYIAAISNGILGDEMGDGILPTDYEPQAVLDDMSEIDRLTKQIDEINSRILPFIDFRLYN